MIGQWREHRPISVGFGFRVLGGNSRDMVILDIREKDAFEAGHVPGAHHLPRGQLELRVDTELPDPTVRIVTCCEFGKISTLAAAITVGAVLPDLPCRRSASSWTPASGTPYSTAL